MSSTKTTKRIATTYLIFKHSIRINLTFTHDDRLFSIAVYILLLIFLLFFWHDFRKKYYDKFLERKKNTHNKINKKLSETQEFFFAFNSSICIQRLVLLMF